MPIGASKVGALGGLVPGGSVTFNASGTWDVPPGVKIVSITGVGGTGNPGNAGNPGNPGNPGTGGAGGGSGGLGYPFGLLQEGRRGGLAYKNVCGFFNVSDPVSANFGVNQTSSNQYAFGGFCLNSPIPPVGTSGQSGRSGNAGTAGNPGNPGNTGCSSLALCNTFPGGAGGNAGTGGAAGNGGSGGQGGGGGNPAPGNGGAGGTGGGNGGNGGTFPGNPAQYIWGPMGGGGAGSVNSGQSGSPTQLTNCAQLNNMPSARFTIGGQGNVTGPLPNGQDINLNPGSTPALMGGGTWTVSPTPTNANLTGRTSVALYAGNQFLAEPCGTRPSFNNLSPAPLRPDAVRAGGGGAGLAPSSASPPPSGTRNYGGGGGGGGRGNAGNLAGPTPTPSGVAATPLTFNCVPVTPGTPTPITVASPGGQIVISWNPQ